MAPDDSFFVYDNNGIVTSVHLKTGIAPIVFRVAIGVQEHTYRVFTDNGESAHVIQSYRSELIDIYHRYECILSEASGSEVIVPACRPHLPLITAHNFAALCYCCTAFNVKDNRA